LSPRGCTAKNPLFSLQVGSSVFALAGGKSKLPCFPRMNNDLEQFLPLSSSLPFSSSWNVRGGATPRRKDVKPLDLMQIAHHTNPSMDAPMGSMDELDLTPRESSWANRNPRRNRMACKPVPLDSRPANPSLGRHRVLSPSRSDGFQISSTELPAPDRSPSPGRGWAPGRFHWTDHTGAMVCDIGRATVPNFRQACDAPVTELRGRCAVSQRSFHNHEHVVLTERRGRNIVREGRDEGHHDHGMGLSVTELRGKRGL